MNTVPLHTAALRRRSGACARRASGQAVVEFLAGAGTLVALLAGTTLVARLHDLQWTTIAASRYAAFDLAMRAGGTSATLVERRLRQRFYERGGALRADDGRRDDEPWRATDSNWTQLSPAALRFVERPSDVTLQARDSAAPGRAAALAGTVVALADRAALLNGGRFDVERRGFHAARVATRVAPLSAAPAPVSELALTLAERTHVLGNGWASSGPGQVESRTSAFVPSASLRALRPVLAAFRWALRLFEPSIDGLCLGRIDPELVPLDRLGAPGSSERGNWSPPC